MGVIDPGTTTVGCIEAGWAKVGAIEPELGFTIVGINEAVVIGAVGIIDATGCAMVGAMDPGTTTVGCIETGWAKVGAIEPALGFPIVGINEAVVIGAVGIIDATGCAMVGAMDPGTTTVGCIETG